MENIIKKILNNVQLENVSIENVIFGVNQSEIQRNESEINVINSIVLETKWQIWKNRNIVKFEKKDSLCVNEIYMHVAKNCQCRFEILLNNGKIKDVIKHVIDKIPDLMDK